MSERGILIRYNEVALKGANRAWFEEKLIHNARKLIQRARQAPPDAGELAPIELRSLRGKILLNSRWDEPVRDALTRVFGVSSFSPMRVVPTDKEAIRAAAIEEFDSYVASHGLPPSFRVTTKRSDKAFPETSMDIDLFVGGAIHSRHPGLELKLKKPDFTLGIDVHFKQSYIWMERVAGPGGLPVGTNGNVLCLISGGLDSPVAAIQMLKRGATVSFVHFYGEPFVGPEVLEKIEDLCRIVNRYQAVPAPIYVIPFGKIQEKIALATTPKMRTILYRRMMVRIANRLAEWIGAQALITGESLGQVASQTLENIANIDRVAKMPIFRPLISHDKDEIVNLAKALGTYEPSIRPAADCCTLFADRHPTLRSSLDAIEEQERKFPVDDFVIEALESRRKIWIDRPKDREAGA